MFNFLSTIKENISSSLGIANKTAYNQNAMGFYLSDPKYWVNLNFKFVVADVGDAINGGNPFFKDIVDLAHKRGKPLVARYKLDHDAYTICPFGREDLLPVPAKDEMLQTLIQTLRHKTYQALVIDINDPLGHDGKPVAPTWISWGAKMFMKRVKAWLAINKPNVKLMIGVSDELVKEYASNTDLSEWIKEFDTFVPQSVSTKLLVESFPPGTEKPRYYGKTWKFWKYSNNFGLVLFNGNDAALKTYLGFGGVAKPEEPEVPVDSSKYVSKAEFDVLKAEFNGLKTAYWNHTHPLVKTGEDSIVVGKPK
jgi:hypothetical protein